MAFCCRISSVPGFPGLRRFPEGRKFKQWTGNDSKALMKVKTSLLLSIIANVLLQVFIPAITGHVPDDIVKCIVAFTDFC